MAHILKYYDSSISISKAARLMLIMTNEGSGLHGVPSHTPF